MHPYLAVTEDARQTRLHAARHLLNVAEEECPAERPVQAASRRNVVEALVDIARGPEDDLLDLRPCGAVDDDERRTGFERPGAVSKQIFERSVHARRCAPVNRAGHDLSP